MKYKYHFSVFFFTLTFQLLIFNFFFNYDFQNILNFSNDALIYYEALLQINRIFIEKINFYIFFDYPYFNYPHLIFNFFIELIFGNNQIGYFIFNSIILVVIFSLLLRILNFFSIDVLDNCKLITSLVIILNPFIYLVSMIRGKDIIFSLIFLYIIYFIIYFNNYSKAQIYSVFKKHIKFKIYIFFFILSSIYLTILRPQISNILIISIIFFIFLIFFSNIFFKKNFKFSLYENIILIFILILGLVCYELILDVVLISNDKIYYEDSLRDLNNRSVHSLTWEYVKYIPDIIEKFTRIVADKRFQLYSIGLENNSYLGVSASESYKFTNIIEVTKALPLIIFHSIFNLDINILYKSNLNNLVYFIYSFILIFSLSVFIINLNIDNLSYILFLSIYLISNFIIYFVTPIDGSFVRYKLALDLILISFGLNKLKFICNFFLVYILNFIQSFKNNKNLNLNIHKLSFFMKSFSLNSLLILVFSVLMIYREFLIFTNFLYDEKLIKYFIIMSFIGFMSSSLTAPIIDTLSRQTYKNKNIFIKLLINTLIGLLIFFFVLIFLLTFFEIYFFKFIYNLDNYEFEYLFFKIFFILFSIPINCILSSYLIYKNKSIFIHISQMIVPIFFILYFYLYSLIFINDVYLIISISVLLNTITLLILCIKNGLNISIKDLISFNFLEFIHIVKALLKNIINNFFIPFILLLSLIITSNFNQDHFVYYGFSIRFLNISHSIFVILFTSSLLSYLRDKSNLFLSEKNILLNILFLSLPLFFIILLFYPFIYLSIKPVLINFNLDVNILFENIVFIIFVIPILCIISLINKFYIYLKKESVLLFSNLISLIFSAFSLIILKIIFINFLSNHFIILMYIFINVLVFSSFFLFESTKYKFLLFAHIFFILSFLYSLFYFLLNDNSHIIIFLSLASIIIISIYEKFLFYKKI